MRKRSTCRNSPQRARCRLRGSEFALCRNALLLMERVIQDLGAGVQFLRAQGYDKIVLVGNPGGASLSAFYQRRRNT